MKAQNEQKNKFNELLKDQQAANTIHPLADMWVCLDVQWAYNKLNGII